MVMGSAFDDFSLIEYIDFIHIPYRGQPVSDDDRGAAFHQRVKCALHERFRLGIEAGSGFVQDKNCRIPHHSPCDWQPLQQEPRISVAHVFPLSGYALTVCMLSYPIYNT